MTLRTQCLSIIALLAFSISSWASNLTPQIRIRAPQSEFDASHDYFRSLINLALEKSALNSSKNSPIHIQPAPYMVQERALKELRAGRLIDIYWAGTNIEREQTLRAIRIPLTKGLLGFRVFAISKNNHDLLAKVKDKNDLKKLILCQGAHWPDTDIMLAAGLNVMPGAVYENMFRQVAAGRCDAFPRGIQEGYAEVTARTNTYPGLELYSDTILYYPFPMYFFVNSKNEALAKHLEQGLEAAITDGSFDKHMRSHPVTRHLFPLDRWINNRYIKLGNPFLPEDTDLSNSRYWITPPQ